MSKAGDSGPGVCVLVSGGVDSAVLVQEALDQDREVFPLFVRIGLNWEEAELHWLRCLLGRLANSQLRELTVLACDLKPLFAGHWAFNGLQVPDAASPDEAVYLPGRNLFLLTQAAVFCQTRDLGEIWIGVLKGNPFGDGQPEFFRSFEEMSHFSLPTPVRVVAPFQKLGKAELLRRHPGFPFELTFSCLSPQGTRSCGNCNKCEEKRRAFQAAGIGDKNL